jgi:uncharacterized membrane protein YdbT with pleckstrin-like domain
MTDEQILYESHPAMFRSHPIAFILCLVLCAVGVGLVIFLFWALGCAATTLTVTDKRVILRKGLLSKYVNEVMNSDVRNIQVSQTFLQRLFGVGTIGISTAAQSGIEIEVVGIPHPDQVREIIDAHRA